MKSNSKTKPGEGDELSKVVEASEYKTYEYRVVKIALDRLPYNHYCGYIRVENHEEIKWESSVNSEGDYVPADIIIHGGITFGPTEDGWVGFDCAHSGDCSFDEDGPLEGSVNMREYSSGRDDFYREWYPEDVADECKDIIDQVLATVGNRCSCSQEMLFDEDSEEHYCPYCDG